jgi:hypothetical protein
MSVAPAGDATAHADWRAAQFEGNRVTVINQASAQDKPQRGIVKTIVLAMAIGVIAVCAAPASASPITDIYDPATDVFFQKDGQACTGSNPDHTVTGDASSAYSCESLVFTHSIRPEFDPALNALYDATLTLSFRDDEQGNPESFALYLDQANLGTTGISTGSGTRSSFPYDVKLRVADNGQLEVKIVRAGNNNSDFYFEKSTLDAHYGSSESAALTPVPEPTALLLLGSGLTGVAARLRRKRQPQA